MFYSIKEVSERYGVAPKTIWRWIREGRFPKPLKLSPKTARWHEAELQAYAEGLKR